jgi:TPR repeat protein
MAEANERSAKALSEKEAAVKQEQEAQRRRARWATTATVVGAVAIILAAAAGLAFWQARKYSGDASEVIYELLSKMEDQQRAKAFGLFQRAVMLGNASPLRYLGVAYRNGWGVTKNVDTAINELDRAAAKGDTDAMDNLGSINESGEAGGAAKYDEVRKWYEKAANNLNSMNNLGRLYDTGRAVPLDAAEAAYWSTGFPPGAAKAIYWYDLVPRADTPCSRDETAKGAEADAAFHLGQHYEAGRGVPQDYDKARNHYEDAAKANHADAMVRLAALYEAGRGVPQGYSEARKLYENAAKLANNANAMFRPGQLYEEGRQDVAQDAGKMIAWYERAADWGHAGAKLKLSELYGKSVCVAPDQAKARDWYEKARASYEEAAKNGDAKARERLQSLPVDYSGTGG